MTKGRRGLLPLREPATSILPVLVAIYSYCVGRVLVLGLTTREAPEVFLTPVVLGRGLQFWLSAGNLLWALFFTVHLIALLAAGREARKMDVLIALIGIAGFLIMELKMPVVFQVMADLRAAQ